MITIATNGCFDILHIGHIRLLKYAKSLGDKLIVGINSDNSVRALKGHNRPVNTESIRKEILLSLKFVDEVIIFDDLNCINFLKNVKPNVYVKGGDYNILSINPLEFQYLKLNNIEIKFSEHLTGHSTTNYLRHEN